MYDHAKNERNIRERDLDFARARDFDLPSAVLKPVYRNGEWGTEAIGYLDDRLHVLCYKRCDAGIRVISFRKANEREAKRNGFELRR
jgi:uncharacterized DUF497 family protein